MAQEAMNPWIGMDPNAKKRLQLLLSQNSLPLRSAANAPTAQIPASVPPAFMPGQPRADRGPPVVPYRDVASQKTPPSGPAGVGAAMPDSGSYHQTDAADKDTKTATDQTPHSGATATKSPWLQFTDPKTPVATTAKGTESGGAPAQGAPELTPGQGPGSTQATDLQKLSAGIGNAAISGGPANSIFSGNKNGKDIFSQLLPEVGNAAHLQPGTNQLQPPPMMTVMGMPVPMGSSSSESDVKGETSQTGTQAQAVGRPEFNEANSRVMDIPGMQMQKDDLGAMRQAIGKLLGVEQGKTPYQHMDLSPYFELFNSWFPNKKMGYKSPETYLPLLAELGKTLTTAEGGFSKNAIEALYGNFINKTTGVTSLGGEAKRGVTAGGANHMDPMAIPRFVAEQDQRQFERGQQTSRSVEEAMKGMPDQSFLQNLKNISDMAEKYKGGHGGQLPGYYKNPVTGASGKKPDFMNGILGDQDALDLQRYATTLQNVNMHSQFGGKQTEQEFVRDSRQMGTGMLQGGTQFLKAMRDYQNSARKHLQSILDGMPAAAREQYLKGSGVKPEDLNFKFDLEDKAAEKGAGGGTNISAGLTKEAAENLVAKGHLKKQVNKKTGATRYLDAQGNVVNAQ